MDQGPHQGAAGFDISGIIDSLKGVGDPLTAHNKTIKTVGLVVGGIIGAILALIIVMSIARSVIDALGVFGVLVGIFLIFAVLGVVSAARAHARESREARTLASLPPSVQHVVAQMDGGAQAAFFNEYERLKKRASISYLLWWFFGAHYFYLRQAGLNVVYWLTFAGGGWWALLDLFRMRSLVRAANEQSARQALQTLHIGAAFAQMPAAPALMAQPVPPTPTIHPTLGPQVQDD